MAAYNLHIPERPPSQRAWVVRASGGIFLEHFLQSDIVAIGHLDGFRRVRKSLGPLEIPKQDVDAWLRAKEGMKRGRATSHSGQVARFISDMKRGDLVISVDQRNFVAGIVTGPAYISPHSIRIPRGRNSFATLEYQLRRPVSWGPTIRRSTLPYAIEMSLFSHQTVFNIDDHARAIYHLLYPAFVWDGTLHFSLKLTRNQAVPNALLAQLLLALSYLEAIAPVSAGTKRQLHEIESEILAGAFAEELHLSVKAGFMSLGDLWGTLPASARTMATFTVLLMLTVGGIDIEDVHVSAGNFHVSIGKVNVPPLIDQSKMDAVLHYVKQHGVDKFIAAVGLALPDYNTKPLQAPKPPSPKPDETTVVLIDTTRRRG